MSLIELFLDDAATTDELMTQCSGGPLTPWSYTSLRLSSSWTMPHHRRTHTLRMRHVLRNTRFARNRVLIFLHRWTQCFRERYG